MRIVRGVSFCVLTWALTWGVMSAHAAERDSRSISIERQLAEFARNPREAMHRLPPRRDRSGKRVPGTKSVFSREEISRGEYVDAKIHWRRKHFGLSGDASGALGAALLERRRANDEPGMLVDQFRLRNIAAIDSAELTSARLEESPWSDDYWPLASGAVAKRYVDYRFPVHGSWKDAYDYFLESRESTSVDALSPAEKYDLLLGDAENSLAKAMWNEGGAYFERFGEVEQWMGLCHGWAAASYMMPRPKKAVEVVAADGVTRLRFYPSDIKALATLLWAKARYDVRHVGGRCDSKNPAEDENGRITDPDCFDTNPSTWHLAVVNQLGVSRRSLVLDATFDYQVWNQPLYSYRYSYFNPKTNKPVATLEQARVRLSEFEEDKFRKYRSNEAEWVVGIAMDLTYVVEAYPTQTPEDDESRDSTHEVRYLYDLELDARGNVIGGEWYSNLHPDFLWTPAKDARARSLGDVFLDRSGVPDASWDGRGPVPSVWQDVGRRSARYGQPLARVVEALMVLAQLDSP